MIRFFCIWLVGIGMMAHTPALMVNTDRPNNMEYIPGGIYTPLYSIDTNKVVTDPFYMDKYPVTNEDYFYFLQKYPAWNRQQIKPVFADEGYLKHWPEKLSDSEELKQLRNKPVVNVSWFAAKKYCECQGKRLPTVDEWEFVALASETDPVGANDSSFYQRILDWYSRPSKQALGDVGSTFKNFYGIYDIYGMVWEWVLDFNTALISGESRGDTGLDRNLFCGSGASGASDPSNYVAFMRYAFRASLNANYSVNNLGFRCARDLKQ